jgi:hypothetical protein
MRQILLTALCAAGVLALSGLITPASAARYCLQGASWGFPGNCQFSTLQQCRASASGTFATCGLNPRYAYARQRHRSGQNY